MIQAIIKKEIEFEKDGNMVEEPVLKKDHTILTYPDNMPKNIKTELKEKHKSDCFFRLAYWEKGGGSFEGGKVQVVCDINGFQETPVFIVDTGWRVNLNHALFTGKELITVKLEEVYVEGDRLFKCLIQKNQISARTGKYSNFTLYNDFIDNIYEPPEEIAEFNLALEAAYQKIKDFKCVKAYYYNS